MATDGDRLYDARAQLRIAREALEHINGEAAACLSDGAISARWVDVQSRAALERIKEMGA